MNRTASHQGKEEANTSTSADYTVSQSLVFSDLENCLRVYERGKEEPVDSGKGKTQENTGESAVERPQP